LLKCPAHEAIAGRVDGQFIEPARHSTAREEVPACRLENIDPPAHPIDDGFPSAVTQAKQSTLPLLDRVRQDLGN